MQNNFDTKSIEVLNNLCQAFEKTYTQRPNLLSPYSIGVEIEIKFKNLFPELHEKYFLSNSEFINFSREEKEKINSEVSFAEKEILPLFEKTLNCGIPRGLDKYWEFSFLPVYNTTLIINQLDVLKQVGLIPKGKHSLHITIGGLTATSETFWILLVLELLYVSKERIQSGFGKKNTESATWAKKGDGGILVKNYNDLIEETIGCEFRTLQFDGDLDRLYEMFSVLISLLSEKKEIVLKVKDEIVKNGLPNENWNKPHNNPEVWQKYIDKFDYFSNFVKSNI